MSANWQTFLKHADRDPLEQLGELTDEYTHLLLLEGCKLYYELTSLSTRPMEVFYSYDVFLDGDAQDRELRRVDILKVEVGPSDAPKSGRPQHARGGNSPLITSSSRYKRLKASRAFSASACVR
jgi:hypothetical protein